MPRPLHDIAPKTELFDPGRARGVPIPWWTKIAAKIVLSRVLRSYDARKRLGLFRHGMTDADIAGHEKFFQLALDHHTAYGSGGVGTVVELGPGDSLGTSLFAAAAGARRIWLVDVGDFATSDMAVYRGIAKLIEDRVPGFSARVDFTDCDRMLQSLGASYRTDGISSLADIPSDSVDIVLSCAVLEHVRRREFGPAMGEISRILRPGGTGYHQVDLSDHLGGALNNLRFSEAAWEHPLMADSGFYTNRLRCAEIIAAMREAGLEVALARIERWPAPPTARAAMDRRFRALSNDDLRIANFAVALRKPLNA